MLAVSSVAAQDSLSKNKSGGYNILPITLHSPETSWAFGVFINYTFRGEKDTLQKHPSQVEAGGDYTLNNQFSVFLPFRIYLARDRYVTYGELNYNKYSYYFYGIGNNQSVHAEELFKINFARARVNFLKTIFKNTYLGVRFWVEKYKIIDTEPGKQLSSGSVYGTQGGYVSGLGPVLNYDTRDRIFYPSSGFFIDAAWLLHSKITGSNYIYQRLTVDASSYKLIKDRLILATNVFADITNGNIPFNHLALLGGISKMRGIYEGRFRDNILLSFGSELRFGIYRRLRGSVFGNTGGVSSTAGTLFNSFRFTYGGGLRFAINKKEMLNLRIDVGIYKKEPAFYFTVGEAF